MEIDVNAIDLSLDAFNIFYLRVFVDIIHIFIRSHFWNRQISKLFCRYLPFNTTTFILFCLKQGNATTYITFCHYTV